MRRRILSLTTIMIIASLTLFSGCAKKTVKTEEIATEKAPSVTEPTAPVMKPTMEEGMGMEESLESNPYSPPQAEILEGRSTAPFLPIYFDFDKSNIRADQKSRIVGNGEYLSRNNRSSVRIEGNCDERGTNEYNMALGERRAQSAKKYLVNLGVSASRIKTISFGEERPLNHGHDEHAWSQNRRDDFILIQ